MKRMRATARAHGAVTVVNAIATGKGAALGVRLATTATVELTPSKSPSVEVDLPEKGEDPTLAKRCVEKVLERVGRMEDGLAARVKTESDIPMSRGLKSSSAAANAICLAAFAALGESPGDEELLNTAVDAALDAGVTITGAYDDACASYYGGFVATDNTARKLMFREALSDAYAVILVVPPRKIRKHEAAKAPVGPLKPVIDEAWSKAVRGRWSEAMLLNSLAYGAAYDLSNRFVLEALEQGASSGGISGTGPAIALLAMVEDAERLRDLAQQRAPAGATVMMTELNDEKAEVLA